MGCNCWNRRQQQPARVPNAPKAPQAPPSKPIIREIVLPQPQVGGGVPMSKFCNKCGWLVKRVQFADPRSGITVEKFICPNRDCKNYSS